uniref:MHC class I-like antigen recognition-like domain-containing protein n=1 Tax=Salvator merianae TaxID=96440 RepID=A0A8D0CCK5_SALMN
RLFCSEHGLSRLVLAVPTQTITPPQDVFAVGVDWPFPLSIPADSIPRFFVIVGYVDGQPFVHYDSNTKKMFPQVSWIKEVEKEDPHYWDVNTLNALGAELTFRKDIDILRNRYNQTGGEWP